MRNMFKSSSVIFAAVLVLSAGDICYCDDSSQNLKTFRGRVMEIDWVGSLLTVDGGDAMTFHVPPGLKIRYGTGTASLEDLEQGDYVLIKYADDPAGTPKAVSIALDKSYPEF